MDFLTRHNFSLSIADNLHKKIQADMKKGLTSGGADQAMIKAGSACVRTIKEEEKVIVIDAGGTNFRSCLVTKTSSGITISDFEKRSMPAIDRELSRQEFYNAITENISRLKDKADKISFCFSYAMAITEDGDGKIIRFSKEVKAPEAIGSYLGQELLAELKMQGWKKIKKINVLNDTTALLLSSFIEDSGRKWSSHIAYILGTGMNSAFIDKKRIIVTECGMFSQLPQSDFDLAVSNKTNQPKQSILEKMCSGAYLGDLAFEMIKGACSENEFSPQFCKAFSKLKSLRTSDFDGLLYDTKKTCLSELNEIGNKEDRMLLKEIITAIITRSAFLSAEAIFAATLSADKEKEDSPVCITCNGSTFWKTPLLKEKVESRLRDLLSTPFEIIQINDDITKGSFAAAFIH